MQRRKRNVDEELSYGYGRRAGYVRQSDLAGARCADFGTSAEQSLYRPLSAKNPRADSDPHSRAGLAASLYGRSEIGTSHRAAGRQLIFTIAVGIPSSKDR